MKLIMIVAVAALLSVPAFAKDNAKAVKKAEAAMMKACKKEYPDAVKGKKFKEVAEWVETEERGANADTFKKSKCYDLHEKWEGVAGQNEAGESEHKE